MIWFIIKTSFFFLSSFSHKIQFKLYNYLIFFITKVIISLIREPIPGGLWITNRKHIQFIIGKI